MSYRDGSTTCYWVGGTADLTKTIEQEPMARITRVIVRQPMSSPMATAYATKGNRHYHETCEVHYHYYELTRLTTSEGEIGIYTYAPEHGGAW
jgi:hypothetical protein